MGRKPGTQGRHYCGVEYGAPTRRTLHMYCAKEGMYLRAFARDIRTGFWKLSESPDLQHCIERITRNQGVKSVKVFNFLTVEEAENMVRYHRTFRLHSLNNFRSLENG